MKKEPMSLGRSLYESPSCESVQLSAGWATCQAASSVYNSYGLHDITGGDVETFDDWN